ncbi:MAG: helix-turn-helix transcriptional regulator [Alphaproteobacteria bacterium]|nr:helix-turn-helix transcriptional regulator [Alphaproteobacteria bacterium]
MLSHKQIWSAMDALAARYGHSPSGLARAAGLDPTTFNKSKRHGPQGRLRWPSTESIAKILHVTGASFEEFVALVSKPGSSRHSSGRTLPLLKLKEAAKKGVFDAEGRPTGKAWDQVAFPGVADEHGFALEISSDGAAPVFRVGDIVVVSPASELRRDDRVVVKTKDGCSVMRFVRRTAKRLELKSLNPSLPDRVLDNDHVEWVARIVMVRY